MARKKGRRMKEIKMRKQEMKYKTNRSHKDKHIGG